MASYTPMDRITRRLECGCPVNPFKTMTTNISNIVNRKSVRWLVLALVALMTVTSLVGLAAADLDGTENEFYNQTVPITDNTTDLELTINGTSGYDVYVNYYRIADDSESTQTLESEDVTLSSPTGETINTTYEVQTSNTAAYRVVVHNNGYAVMAPDIGNIIATPLSLDGGGGGFLKTQGEYDPIKVVVMFVAVVAAAKVLTGDD